MEPIYFKDLHRHTQRTGLCTPPTLLTAALPAPLLFTDKKPVPQEETRDHFKFSKFSDLQNRPSMIRIANDSKGERCEIKPP
ncbi:MAG: hypothetical protein COB46_04150 [Rhodospirillaceae bacterium]|nr:MAG: hypothetical protein COB46_04150 [Rhodospirillaceae bacterium]